MQLSFSTTVTHKGRRYRLFFVGFFRLSLVAVFLFSTTVAYYHSLFAIFFSPFHRFPVSPFHRVPCPMPHVPLSVVPLSCCLVIPLSHHTLPQRCFQQCVLLRQFFDLFAERRHLDGIMQANQVEEQDAEQENRCRR